MACQCAKWAEPMPIAGAVHLISSTSPPLQHARVLTKAGNKLLDNDTGRFQLQAVSV